MKKHLITLALVLLIPVLLLAQGTNAQYRMYVNQYKDLAIEQMLKYHIPASITLAQGILERPGFKR